MKINQTEGQIVSIIRFGRKIDITSKLKIVEARAKSISSNKNKKYINESIKRLKSSINILDFKDSVIKTFQLKEAVNQLLEKEQNYIINFPDLQYVKSAQLEEFPGDTTETVYLKFAIGLSPSGDNREEVRDQLVLLTRKLSRLENRITNEILKSKDWLLFTGDHIWSTSLGTSRDEVGVIVNGNVEIALHTTSASLQELGIECKKLLEEIDQKVPEWFGEEAVSVEEYSSINAAYDKAAAEKGKKGTNKTIKRQKVVTPVPDEDEENLGNEEDEDEKYYNSEKEFEVPETEPSAEDIKKASKGVRLAEAKEIIRELEKLTGKKVLFEMNTTIKKRA